MNLELKRKTEKLSREKNSADEDVQTGRDEHEGVRHNFMRVA